MIEVSYDTGSDVHNKRYLEKKLCCHFVVRPFVIAALAALNTEVMD